MDFSAVCRTCLSDSNLNPIFHDPEGEMQYSAAIYAAAGVMVEPNDGLPQQMCSTCLHVLNKHLHFRKQCKRVETQLFKYKNNPTNTYKNISKYVDEKQIIQMQPCKIEIIDYDQELTEDSGQELMEDNGQELTENNCQELTENNCQELTEDMKSECTEYLDEDILDEKPLNNLIEHNISDSQSSIKEENTYREECSLNEEYLELESSNSSDEKYNLTNTDEFILPPNKTQIIEQQNNCEKKITKEQNDIILEQVQAECDAESQLTYPLASGRVKCRLCGKVLSAFGMIYHMARKHPQADSNIIKCDQCDRYLKKTGLARHIQKAHGGTKSNRCVYCKKELQKEGSLLKHICSVRIRSDKNKLMGECDVCHKTMQKASLKLHNAVKHAGLKPVCEHCGHSFSNTHRLREHYRSKHGYDKIKCDKCPFQSSSALAMQNHERRHLGEKPFECECGAKFHAAYLLAQHSQTHRDKLYKCDQCPKSFKVNNTLHLHKATCHSKTQVKCHMCDKIYSNRHYVVKHLRHTHGYLGTVPVLEKVDDISVNTEIGRENNEIAPEKSYKAP